MMLQKFEPGSVYGVYREVELISVSRRMFLLLVSNDLVKMKTIDSESG